ncbi:MAG: 4Fe-4S binding protein [Thermoflexales bacterium]|nr:4Fe-4S binding protein [Thermoflexales bacterium]
MAEQIDHPSPGNIPWVDEKACRACRHCLAREVCRSKALRALDPGEPPWVDGNRCYGCLVCIPACPFGAIRPFSNGDRP